MKELPDEIVSFILSFVENPRPITNGIIKYLIYDCYEEDSDCDYGPGGLGGPEPSNSDFFTSNSDFFTSKSDFFIILFTKNIPK